MVIEGNDLHSHPVEVGVTQGSAVFPILFAIHTTGAMKSVEERVHAVEGLSFVDDIGWVSNGKNAKEGVMKLASSHTETIEWANRRDLQFNTAKTEAALLTCRRGHKKHLWPKLRVLIRVGDSCVRFNKEATEWLGVWIDSGVMFKEHHNRCGKKHWTVESQLRVLTRMRWIVSERVTAIAVAGVQETAPYSNEFWWDPKDISRRDHSEHLLNGHARSTLGALPTTPLGPLTRDSGPTPAPVAPDSR